MKTTAVSRATRIVISAAVLALACASLSDVAHTQPASKLSPIVNGYGLLLGASRNGKWLAWEKTHALLKGGEKYRFPSQSGGAVVCVGTRPTVSEASGTAYVVKFDGKKPQESGGVIGIDGAWNAMPRLLKPIAASQPDYLNSVAAVLRAHGLTHARPHIVRAVRVDLEGRGRDSVVIEAASPGYSVSDGAAHAKPNTYSFVLLRTLTQGQVRSFLLNGEFAGKGTGGPVEQYSLAQILDLNGDGVLEIVVETRYFEGGGNEVYEIHNGRPQRVLKVEDGA